MNLIKKSNKKKQACIESIEHWEQDVVDMFDDGFLVYRYINNDLFWYENDKKDSFLEMKIGIMTCSLCLKYIKMEFIGNSLIPDCSNCPWYNYSKNNSCVEKNQEYYIFYKNPTRKNALKVIEKLWKIGINK